MGQGQLQKKYFCFFKMNLYKAAVSRAPSPTYFAKCNVVEVRIFLIDFTEFFFFFLNLFLGYWSNKCYLLSTTLVFLGFLSMGL